MNTTTTVKTLTAEVRVLMVGNRQVTLSVYRQLDEVKPTELEPFGRVNDSKDTGIWVVGRSSSGELVRAEADGRFTNDFYWWFDMPVGAFEIGSKAFNALDLSRTSARYGDACRTADREGFVRVDDRRVKYNIIEDYPMHEDPTRRGVADGWWPEVSRLAREVIDARAKVEAAYMLLADLPLIVLAGLR